MGLGLDSAVDLYLDHLKIERGLSRNTLSAYAGDLAKFRAHYPDWELTYTLPQIVDEMVAQMADAARR